MIWHTPSINMREESKNESDFVMAQSVIMEESMKS